MSAAASSDTDVIVIGAGFSGLAAAMELSRQGVGCVVLEARDRVGGRVLNHELSAGEVVEVGGQWVGPTQHALLELAREMEVAVYPTHVAGDNLIEYRDKVRRYTGSIPRINPAVLLEVERIRRALNRLSGTVPPEAPWEAPRATEWDRITFSEWMRRRTYTPGARLLVSLAIRSVFGTEPEDLSLLHVLFYVRSAGSFDQLIDTAGGAQDSRFEGGSQVVAIRMAEHLGDSVRLSSPVRRVEETATGIRATTDTGVVEAKRIIAAISPTLCARIDWDPPMPGERDQMTQRMPQGAIVKCMAVYPEPFWRSDGLSGLAVSDGGGINAIFDNTPPAGTPGVLLGFLDGRAARRFGSATPNERQSELVGTLTRIFGRAAAEPIEYVERVWADEVWSRGCYSGAFGPGGWTDFGSALREPVGRVHWAGTETATVWNGYIEGAITAGRRAAAEVAALA